MFDLLDVFDLYIKGNTVTSWALARACQDTGIASVYVDATEGDGATDQAAILTPNLTKVVHALGLQQALADIGHQPDRAQVRFGKSAYLLSELPLGKFCAQRYGVPLLNVEHAAFIDLLRDPAVLGDAPESDRWLIVETMAEAQTADVTQGIRHSVLPRINSTANANITWLNQDAVIWQFSTIEHTHFYIVAATDTSLDLNNWHASLHEPITQAGEPIVSTTTLPLENWYQGNVAFAGEAAFRPAAQWREFTYLGLEDAWVLSRMLENYEEGWAEGFASYEQFRRARARRVARNIASTWSGMQQSSSIKRLGRNLNIALSARFLPEIAMQKIDWHYGHDCIRGFR